MDQSCEASEWELSSNHFGNEIKKGVEKLSGKKYMAEKAKWAIYMLILKFVILKKVKNKIKQ